MRFVVDGKGAPLLTCWLAACIVLALASPARALDLKECLERGLANSDRVKAAQAGIDERRAERWGAATGFVPQLSLQSRQLWLDVHSTMPDLSIKLPAGLPAEQAALFDSVLGQFDLNALTAVPDHNRDLTLQAYQPLSQLPLIAMYNEMAGDAAQLARLNYEVTRDQIALYLAANFFQAVIAEKRAAALQRALEQLDRLQQDAAAMKAQEIITKADLLKIQMQRGEVELQLQQARSDEALSKSHLAQLLDLPADQLALREPEPPPAIPHDLAWCLKRAEEDRRELKMLGLQEDLARANGTAASLALLPQVGAVASVNWNDDGLDTTPDRTNATGFALSWNFWGMGGDLAKARAAAFAKDRAVHEARASRVELRVAVEKAWRDETLARQAVVVNRRVLAEAEENFRIERLRYQVGETTTFDLLGAQAKLTAAQTACDAARCLAMLADGSLSAAVGQRPFEWLHGGAPLE